MPASTSKRKVTTPIRLQDYEIPKRTTAQTREPQQPLPPEEKSMPIVAEKNETITFYDPASPAQMTDLAKDCHRVMLGEPAEREKWPVRVYKSNAAYGFGLVTKRFIKKNEVIVPYLGVSTFIEDSISAKQEEYAFHFCKDNYILAHKYASVAAFVNHNFSIPNVYCSKEDNQLLFRASCDIPEGSALLLDYGTGYTFKTDPSYLSPYDNGKSPAENLQQNIALYDTDPLKLSKKLKALFQITSQATHAFVPKIYHDPDLMIDEVQPEYKHHQHLPIYLTIVDDKITALQEQPYVSPLMLAWAQKDLIKIKKLMAYGADVFAATGGNLTVLSIATSTLSTRNRDTKALKRLYIALVQRIYLKYKGTYDLDGANAKFESYVKQQVDNTPALAFIRTKFPQLTATKKANLPSVKDTVAPTKMLPPLLPLAGTQNKAVEVKPPSKPPRKKLKVSINTPENAPIFAQKRETLLSLCKGRKHKAIDAMLNKDLAYIFYFCGKEMFLFDTAALETKLKTWQQDFRTVLASQHETLGSVMWEMDPLLRKYFNGQAITFGEKTYQISPEERRCNVRIAVISQSTDVLNEMRDGQLDSTAQLLAKKGFYANRKGAESIHESTEEALYCKVGWKP